MTLARQGRDAGRRFTEGNSIGASNEAFFLDAVQLISLCANVKDRLPRTTRVVLERDVIAEFVGALTGVYHRDELNTLRAEWE